MFCILVYVLSLLCPCRIVPRCICLVCYALVECWAYKCLALCLLTCMSLCSFQVWMSTVITTLWCSLGWSSHGLFINSIFAWSHIACFICIYNFLLTMIMVYCCMQKNMKCIWAGIRWSSKDEFKKQTMAWSYK